MTTSTERNGADRGPSRTAPLCVTCHPPTWQRQFSKEAPGPDRQILSVPSLPSQGVGLLVGGAADSPYPTRPAVSPDVGIGPGAVIASDNTLGSFSPHQGRLYIAYTDRGVDTLSALAASLMAHDWWYSWWD